MVGVEMMGDLNERWAPNETEADSKEENKKTDTKTESTSSSEESKEIDEGTKCSCDEKGCRHYNAGYFTPHNNF